MRLLPFMPLHTPIADAIKFIRVGAFPFLLVSLCFLMAACGKMPPNVDAPPDVDSSAYHQTYPDFSDKPLILKPEPKS